MLLEEKHFGCVSLYVCMVMFVFVCEQKYRLLIEVSSNLLLRLFLVGFMSLI